MAHEPIVYIDRSKIVPGRLEELKARIGELVAFIDAREPQLLYYGFFLDEITSEMTVVAVHPDPASLELHMEVGGEAFRTFADLIQMERIEVYGEPGDEVVVQLEAKARALGKSNAVVIRPRHAGFARVDP